MSFIKEGNIRSNCNDLIYKKGLQCYKGGYVLDLKKSKYKNANNEDGEFVEAIIDSSSYNTYLVRLFLKNYELLESSCTCPDYQDNKKNICKHIVAAYLKYINETEICNPSDIDNLIKVYKGENSISPSEKKKVNLELKLFYDPHEYIENYVELRIGEDKTYTLKSMKEFIDSYTYKKSLQFGKNFVLDFTLHEFTEEDKKIVDFFVELLEISETLLPSYAYTSGANRLIAGKRIYIVSKQLERFIKLIANKRIDVSLPIGEYSKAAIKAEELHIDFVLQKETENIKLAFKENKAPYAINGEGNFFFYEGNIYKMNPKNKEFYMPLIEIMQSNKKSYITIEEKDKINFASYILPKLKSIGNIHVEESIVEDFYEEELNTKFYLDKVGEGIAVDIIFNYGHININPYKKEELGSEKGILIRNIDLESQGIGLLKAQGFQESEYSLVLRDEEKIIDFIYEGIEKLKSFGEVFYSESFKTMRIYSSSSYKSKVRLNDQDMLEFSFSIEGVEKEELKNIFRALREKKKYYKLKDKGFVLLEEENLKSINNLLEYLDIKEEELEKDKIVLPKYNSIYVDRILSNRNAFIINKDKAFKSLVSGVKEIEDADYNLPYNLEGVLRNYQIIGYKWFKTLAYYGFGGILADEMGLGKTLQTIAFLSAEVGDKPSLVVCPTSLVYNWKEEFDKFSPEMRVLVLSGSKGEREELIKSIEQADVVITSYPLLRRDIEIYESLEFKYCILDEAQQIKNASSQNAQCAKSIKAKNKFALTGTPIENSLSELWSIFDFIMPGYLLSHNKFSSKYEIPISKHKEPRAMEELNKKVKPFILRRLKRDVIKELPEKIEHKIVVDMTEEQKKLYIAYVNSFKNEIDIEIQQKGLNKSKFKILSALTRLRQICCDPSTFITDYSGESGKLNSLYEILENCIEENHKILIFSQFTSVLQNIAKELKERNIQYMYLDGAIKAEERLALVKKFNEDHTKVFLISLKAGGAGLNLTGADVVIHFDPWWNPAVEDQATDRAHRIGQSKTVEVIKLIAKGTIEEKMFKLQQKKKEIINQVMGEEALSENFISNMNIEEIKELFEI